MRATPLGGGHFPLAPFVIFLLLGVVVSVVARIFRSSLLLTGPELLVIWIQMVIGSGIAYTGFARTFLVNLTAPVYFQQRLDPPQPGGHNPALQRHYRRQGYGMAGRGLGNPLGSMGETAHALGCFCTALLPGHAVSYQHYLEAVDS